MSLSPAEVVVASLRSIGTAATLASAGAVLAILQLITPATKKDLAKIAMNVTVPCLLFTTILDCPQDFSSEACTDVTSYITSGWPLLILPLVNVLLGLLLGYMVVLLAQPPENARKIIMAAVAFGNTTGMPITLCE